MRLVRELFPARPPAIRVPGGADYTLKGPWTLEGELRPVHRGREEVLTLAGTYSEPLRGFRAFFTLSAEVADQDDLALFAELRRRQTEFRFYPFSGWPRYFWVRVAGSLLEHARSGPSSVRARVSMRGTEIIPGEKMGSFLFITITGSWDGAGLTITWEPLVAEGSLAFIAWKDSETPVGSGTASVLAGRVRISCSEAPSFFTWTHTITQSQGEVAL